MRDTGPVTQRECPLQGDDLLISRTDGSGVIRWANEGFQRVSGFSAEELIGKPHNLVRHPDMPRAAFLDLWTTVRRGEAWRGIVKNRCKNGDHYWVEADVTPIRKDGTVVGYLSIRGRPDPAEQQAAAAQYAELVREEARRGLRPPGTAAKLWRSGLPLEARLGLPILALVALALDPIWLDDLTQRTLTAGTTVALVWLLRGVLLPLWSLRTAVRSGSFDASVDVREGPMAELTRAFNVTQRRFRRVLGEVGRQGRVLRDTVTTLQGANEELSSRTEEQAANLEQGAAGLEELTASVDLTAREARAAADAAAEARRGAEEGRHAFSQLLASVSAMHETAARVGEIITLIDDLSSQTNLLALNAGIEAARAGEHGRGFAVVANEVRGLAIRSSGSARQIRDLVEQSRAGAEGAVQAAAVAGARIQEVTAGSEQVSSRMEEIATSTRELSRALGELSRALAQLDQLTQRNAGMVEQLTERTTELCGQAREMTDLVECFFPPDEGRINAPPARVRPRAATLRTQPAFP